MFLTPGVSSFLEAQGEKPISVGWVISELIMTSALRVLFVVCSAVESH